MKKLIAVLTIASLSVLAIPAQASHGRHGVDRVTQIEQRLDNQRFRIREGIRSGELTRWEAKRLRQQTRQIAALKRDYMNDGFLNRFEFRDLKNRLDRVSDRIYALKHNSRHRHVYHH